MGETPIDEKKKLADEETYEKLKLLVASLKKKYGDAVSQAYNLDGKCRELTTENSTLKQAQTALTQQFNQNLVDLHKLQIFKNEIEPEFKKTKELLQDAEEEIQALRDQHTELKTFILSHEEESKKTSEELAAIKLKETQLERVIQFLRKRSEEAHLETNQLASELATHQELIQNLNDELTRSHNSARDLKEQLHQEKEEHKTSKEEVQALAQQLKELHTRYTELNEETDRLKSTKEALQTLQKEHAFVKQVMMKSVDEAKEALQKLEKKNEENQTEFEEKLKAKDLYYQSEMDVLKEEIRSYETKALEVAKLYESKAEVETEKARLQLELAEAHKRLQESFVEKQDLDSRLKTAQQHLAKKVRDSSVITERMEEQKAKINEQQNQLYLLQVKIGELKNSLDMEAEHQKRQTLKEAEVLKSKELQIHRLEEKYFQLHEKWSQTEAELRELKKVEERFREMQALFSNLGSFLNTTPIKPAPTPLELPKSEPFPEPAKETQSVQVSFFDMPAQKPFKDSFL